MQCIADGLRDAEMEGETSSGMIHHFEINKRDDVLIEYVPSELLPSSAVVYYVHARGVRFDTNPIHAHELKDEFLGSIEYSSRVYTECNLKRAKEDAICHQLPLTKQMQHYN
jgi:hypothetical protein